MAVIVTVPGSYSYTERNLHVTVLGDGTVSASHMHGTSADIGASTFDIFGDGVFTGDNSQVGVDIWGSTAKISIGDGSDTLNVWGSGSITETGAKGHDTIGLYTGNDTISVQGAATVHGSSYGTFGSATVVGGVLTVHQTGGVDKDVAVSGKITIVGGATPTEFVGGKGSASLVGGSGHDTFVGGTGHDTMTGVGDSNVFAFDYGVVGGTHVITNFVAGDSLYLEGHSFGGLERSGDITTSGGNTYISLDGGKTTVELKGFTSLTNSDVTLHKP
jgi:Ca2+-binding RTX toxin-like protein